MGTTHMVTIPEPLILDQWSEENLSYALSQVGGSTDGQTQGSGRDRRVYTRLRDDDLQWVRNARLTLGHGVSLVDLSAGGALIDSPVPLRPASTLTLEIGGAGFETIVPFRVVRCEIGALTPEGTVYRGACEFLRLIELPRQSQAGGREMSPGAYIGLDFALKHLVELAGPSGANQSRDTRTVRQSLHRLRLRALTFPQDPIGSPLAALLARVVPALEYYKGLSSILADIEEELRRTIPQASLRLTNGADLAAPGVRSILINVPGAAESSALVSIDLPKGVVLTAWQSRLLRVTTRLVALLQRLEPVRIPDPVVAPVVAAPASRDTDRPVPEIQESIPSTTTWQKIVVRYAEGQILKGYTQDFSSMRSQFSLWPSIGAAPHERVIVPLARLKGVFFVRDFAGNPGYVERTDISQAQHGRAIEVTLVDDEVIVGRTLSYRPDGYGFFVVPGDPGANNIRIFIVSSSVRQVRFP